MPPPEVPLRKSSDAAAAVAVALAAALVLALAVAAAAGCGAARRGGNVGLLETAEAVAVGPARMRLETLRDRRPYIQLVHNFLSPQEVQHVVRIAEKQGFHGSTVASPKGDLEDADRTSSTCHLNSAQDQVVQAIENRAATLLRMPRGCVEPLQVVKYGAQQQYKPHFDYFPRDSEYFVSNTHHGYVDAAGRERPNQRLYTLFVYLNQPDAAHRACAGGTVFPECNLEIIPKTGMAVLFHNMDELGQEDPMALHGGAINRCASQSYTKYGLNIWVRAFPYPHSDGTTDPARYLGSVPACPPCRTVHPQVRCSK